MDGYMALEPLVRFSWMNSNLGTRQIQYVCYAYCYKFMKHLATVMMWLEELIRALAGAGT